VALKTNFDLMNLIKRILRANLKGRLILRSDINVKLGGKM